MCKYLVLIKYENLIEVELIYFQGCESKILYVNYSIKVL
jgi:hypothetical protein